MTWILEFILGWILKYLAGKAEAAVVAKAKEIALDKERGEVNEANVKAYEEAESEADRVRTATDLLNRVRRP